MRCIRCGEPWDLDSIHDEISAQYGDELEALRARYAGHPARYRYNDPFQAAYEKEFFLPAVARFRAEGCEYFGETCEPSLSALSRELFGMIAELNGDDVDGAESDLDDAEQLGLF
jgi:hypothetical protein